MSDVDLDSRLGHILLESGLITGEQLAEAREMQNAIGGNLGKILRKLDYLTEEDLARHLARLQEVEFADLARQSLSPSVMKLLPRKLMEERLVLPLRLEQGSLTVAMADPTDLEVIEMLRFDAGYNVNAVLARENDIREKLNHYFYDGKEPARSRATYGLTDLVREMKPAAPPARKPVSPPAPQAPPATTAPPAPQATTEQKVDALTSLLIRKGVIDKTEWVRLLGEIAQAKDN